MGPRCSSAETQVCHRNYIIAATLYRTSWPSTIHYQYHCMRSEYIMYYVCSRDFIYCVKKVNYNGRSNYFCQLSELRTQSLTTVYIFWRYGDISIVIYDGSGQLNEFIFNFCSFLVSFYIWRVYISLNDIFIVFCYMPSTPVRENCAQWKQLISVIVEVCNSIIVKKIVIMIPHYRNNS